MNLVKNQEIFFLNENIPMKIRAINEKYAVCTRKFDIVEDWNMAAHRVEMGSFNSIEDALNSYKDDYVYTIINFEEKIKGPHNMVFNLYDFEKDEDMEEILKDLESEEIEISTRNRADLYIDFTKTPNL